MTLVLSVTCYLKDDINMSTIRELTSDEMKLIGGCGDGNNGGDRDRPGRGAPNSCANQVGMGIIIGAFTGFSGGPPGMIGMAIAGGLMGAVSCADNSSAGIISITMVPWVGIKTPIALMGNVADDE
ncbi:hypothetical protein [Serratia nevei]|uniref:hypothetical protein n=1 Tax=Serratia nevei TaxID=2703794 RepID=UPI003FA6B830